MRGYFLVLEGPDGSGKTTLATKIAKTLTQRGYKVNLTREPGGTKISEQIRDVLLDNNNSEMVGRTETLLYAAARAQHVDEFIRPRIDKGEVVICDRFVLSSLAYQGGARKEDIESITLINNYAVNSTNPDRTIFLDLDPIVGIARKTNQQTLDRIETESIDFHKRVYETYLGLIEDYPYSISVVDGSLSPEEVFEQCISIVMEDIL